MEAAKQDIKTKKIYSELNKKHESLIETYRELINNTAENKLYLDITNAYKQYYDNYISNKNRQQTALVNLSKYLDKINKESDSSAKTLKNIKHDQHIILKELDQIHDKINKTRLQK